MRHTLLCHLLLDATVMSRDAATNQDHEMPRALAIRSFWNEVCHQVANVLCGSQIPIEQLMLICDDMADKEHIKTWKTLRAKYLNHADAADL